MVRRIVVPALLAALLGQAACSVPRRPGGPVEGGEDGFQAAGIGLMAPARCGGWEQAAAYWGLASGGSEGGIEAILAEMQEGGEDGFFSPGPDGVAEPCLAGAVGGFVPVGGLAGWSPFADAGPAPEAPGGGVVVLPVGGAWPAPPGGAWPVPPGGAVPGGSVADGGVFPVDGIAALVAPRGGPTRLPEPGTLALLGAAMVALGLLRRDL